MCGSSGLLILLDWSLIHEIVRHGMVTFLHNVHRNPVLRHVELQVRITVLVVHRRRLLESFSRVAVAVVHD